MSAPSQPKLPPAPPIKPDPYECCGSGCTPCIYDYYYDQLDQWEDEHKMTLAEYQKLSAATPQTDNNR